MSHDPVPFDEPAPVDDAAKPATERGAAGSRVGAHPLVWLAAGVVLTLGIVLALRPGTPAPSASPPPIVSSVPLDAPSPSSSARAEFAGLYLRYLLKTYYVYERGFCGGLLVAICRALLHTELLNSPSTCEEVPNDELVLAIGRFQFKTGLPVDGKAGPETVRMMLGGTFNSRRGMAEQYCPGWRPASAASAAPSAPPAAVEW